MAEIAHPRMKPAIESFLDKPEIAVLRPAGSLARFVLRCRNGGEAPAGAAFGLALPEVMNRGASIGERGQPGARVALKLGPDEFLLIVPEAEGEAVAAAIGTALSGQSHSLVDVSNRNLGLILQGPRAAQLLNAGCPLDLSPAAFPIGMATRTLFHKAEITLWRVGEDAFRIELWRSFVPYLAGMMEEAARDCA